MNENLRYEKTALLLGTIMGQLSEVLNYMKRDEANIHNAYDAIFDIQKMAALQIYELFYKKDSE
jgi:hypothetical protein